MRCLAPSNHHRLSPVQRAPAFLRLPSLFLLLLAVSGISGCGSAPEPTAVATGLASGDR